MLFDNIMFLHLVDLALIQLKCMKKKISQFDLKFIFLNVSFLTLDTSIKKYF